MSDSVQVFDPYIELPFLGYKSRISGVQEKYWSLMHFVEAEKLHGVDEAYRAYVLSLRNRDDFILETAGVAAQWEPSNRWSDNRLQALYAGLFMQLVQNKEAATPLLMATDMQYPSATIEQARDSLVKRLASSEPWRRVMFLGPQVHSAMVTGLLDHIFSNRNPDELFILDEKGVAEVIGDYAHDHYIPIRIVGPEESDQIIPEVIDRLSHIFLLGALDATSNRSQQIHEAALAKGINVHQVDLAQ